MPRRPLAVYLELGRRRVFACAVDWPGWCRSGIGDDAALEALAASAPRFAPIAAAAGLAFDPGPLEVVERLEGSATTDFGAPGAVRPADALAVAAREATRMGALVAAGWDALAAAAGRAPAVLRKGPRGGGRDRDAIVDHVAAAEIAYARKLGLRYPGSAAADPAALAAMRRTVLEVVGSPSPAVPVGGPTWPARYAARRIAWHAIDHAWEIDDRSAKA